VSRLKNVSRREFVKSGGRALLGASLAWSGFGRAASAEPDAAYDVVIVGAGIAGLAAGYFLRDKRVLILEKESRPGGRARAGRYEGLPYAMGVSYLGKPYGALKEIIEALNLNLREIPSPLHAYLAGGEIVFGEAGLARLLSEAGGAPDFERFRRAVLETARDYADIPELRMTTRMSALDDISVARWLETNKMPAPLRPVLNVFVRGLFGAGLDEISALSFIPEMAFALSADSAGAYSFDGGLAELTDALARHLGDRVRTGARVERVVKKDDIYAVSYAGADGRISMADAKFVVLAVPAPAALALAPDVLADEQKDILGRILYAASGFAALFSREPIFDRAFDLALPDGGFLSGINDATRVARRFDPSAAAKKAFVLGATIAGANAKDTSFLQLSDEDIRKKAVEGMGRIFPESASKIVGGEVMRFPQAYPVMAPGAYKRLVRLNEITDGRLLLAGDYMIYPSFEAAADSGDFAAEKIKELV
jgi:protoporphyrinogen oxidase